MSEEQKTKIMEVLTAVNKYVEQIQTTLQEESPEGSIDIPDPDTDTEQGIKVTPILMKLKELLTTITKTGGRRSSKKRGTQRKQKRRQRRGSRRAY